MKMKIEKFAEIKNIEVVSPCAIIGRNGAGKTSTMNAYLWALTGKGKDGTEMGEAVYSTKDEPTERLASVEVELSGIHFKRVCRPIYQRQRGTTEQTLKSLCSTTYYVNAVEVTKAQYEQEINNLCGGWSFQLFSDINYFNSLKKDKQTEIFMQMLGVNKDDYFKDIRPIAEVNHEIAEVKSTMKTRENWLDEEKRNLAGTARPTDYTTEINTIKSELEALQEQRPTLTPSQIAENNEISKQIAELQNYAYKVVSCEKRRNLNAKRDAFNDELNNRNNVVRRKIEQEKELEKAKSELKNWENNCEYNFKSPEVEGIRQKIVKYELKKHADEELLANYEEANKEASCGLCPHCTDIFCEYRKTDLPTESDLMRNITQIENDIAGFWAQIHEIEDNWTKQKGKEYAEIQKRITDLESTMPNIAEADERLNKAKEAVSLAEKEYDEETASNEAIAHENEQKRAENERKIAELKAKIHVAQVNINEEKINALKAQLNDLTARQKKTDEINGARKNMANTIEKCEQVLNDLTLQLADLEREEVRYEESDAKYRNDIMTKANDMLPEGVSVNLFRPLVSGNGYENIFELTYHSKKYKNTALQIKGNYDLTMMFQKQFGVDLPVFVDDMANITDDEFIPHGSNIIQIFATKDCDLEVIPL